MPKPEKDIRRKENDRSSPMSMSPQQNITKSIIRIIYQNQMGLNPDTQD